MYKDNFELLEYLFNKGVDINNLFYDENGTKVNTIEVAKINNVPQSIIDWMIRHGAKES